MNKTQKTNSGALPQLRTLEDRAADTQGLARNGRDQRAVVQLVRGEPIGKVNPVASPTKAQANAASGVSRVFVLAKDGTPLMPCKASRARILLKEGRARIHKLYPFTIRLLDVETGETQPVAIKFEPGSTVTGLAVVRLDEKDPSKQTVLHLAEIAHRGKAVRKHMTQRAMFRRRRRTANLRYRPRRFNNRSKPEGWLPPSLQSRMDNVISLMGRYREMAPIRSISVEAVRFDLQKAENPEISGVEYQQGRLAGYEIREYLLEKWGRKCAYCDAENVVLEIEHVQPKACLASNRVSNLTLACRACNEAKGSKPVELFLASRPDKLNKILAQCKEPLAAAAAVNATRTALVLELRKMGLPVETSSGGRTRFNCKTLGIPKTHSLDAACVGWVSSLAGWNIQILAIKASGRGAYQRTRLDSFGLPRCYLTEEKSVKGFRTGDLVRATVPSGKNTGTHTGRVAVRKRGVFNIQTATGTIADVNWKYCRRIVAGDGYTYILEQRRTAIPPHLKEVVPFA